MGERLQYRNPDEKESREGMLCVCPTVRDTNVSFGDLQDNFDLRNLRHETI